MFPAAVAVTAGMAASTRVGVKALATAGTLRRVSAAEMKTT